ncbi:unnamed protein product, partial [Ectocarpus fasciculatus]
SLLTRPRDHIFALQSVVTDMALARDPTLAKVLRVKDMQVGFEGSFGSHAVSPRGLLSTLLNKLVIVEGIVTKCSSVRPKLMKSVHFCPATGSYTSREYRDATAPDIGIEDNGRNRMPTNSAFPTVDATGNPLETEHGYCQYKDCQSVVLQEMPERAKVGQLPRSIEIMLEHDLVDRVKPGDRVQCVGVYRPLASNQNGQTSGIFRSMLMCNNVSVIGKEVGAVHLTGTDVANIRKVSSVPNVMDVIARSLCPSIFGHDFIKKALVLQLLGGCERNLENGTHLRGDINVLMVGDPSTAKSQLLRAVIDIAPLAISTTGRGSSGVGLTAAVTSDPETGERRLEAGAMVLADRGAVCIDEFDKMSENDRVAIHEVMEQQTVTIAKAGMHASLNARCSVVAAANPVYGQYDRSRRPQENIGLPDSLLSRFDLLFIVLDQIDPMLDRRLSEHVIRSHQYRRAGTTMQPEPLNLAASSISLLTEGGADGDEVDMNGDVQKDAVVWQRGGRGSDSSVGDGRAGDVLTKGFLRKYLHFSKSQIKPVLSDIAMDCIATAFAGMRAKQTNKNLPVTARSLETVIRLSSAHAKVRLSNTVDEEDVDVAMELMNFVMFHEVGTPVVPVNAPGGNEKAARGVRRGRDGDTSGDDDEAENECSEGTQQKRSRVDFEEAFAENGEVDINGSRFKKIQSTISKLGQTMGLDLIRVDDLQGRLNSDSDGPAFTSQEISNTLFELERQNKVI